MSGLFTAAEVGAPHKRERLFILAIRERDELANPARSLWNPGEWREPDGTAGALADAPCQRQREPADETDAVAGSWAARDEPRDDGSLMADAVDRQFPQPGRRQARREGSPPTTGKAAVYARNRAGAPWIDVMRPSGRDFPLQPHFGVNRIAKWSPSVTTTITAEGLITSVGTVSHPTLAATNLAASMRRWRLTSAAVVDSATEQRSAGWACWLGNVAALGGWTFVTRISLTTLQATGTGFFGLYGSTAALATTLTLATAINCIGMGFQRGTHTRPQLVSNDGTGAPTLSDRGASFAIATSGVLTSFIAAPPNGSSVWVRVVDEVSAAIFEH